MNKARSNLDSLNKGRTRRSSKSYDKLNRTLEGLEARLDSIGDTTADTSARAKQDRAANHQATSSSFNSLSQEIASLRNEVRDNLENNLRREFDDLRRDLSALSLEISAVRPDEALTSEIAQISSAVDRLAQGDAGHSDTPLHDELRALRDELGVLAKEDSVRAANSNWNDFGKRWSQLENRWSALENNFSGVAKSDDISAVTERLSRLQESIETASNQRFAEQMDERIDQLAASVERFTSENTNAGGKALLENLDHRLDEISRAIAASPAALSSNFDLEALTRIESRITGLNEQLDQLSNAQFSEDLVERFVAVSEKLGQRIDAHDVDSIDNLNAAVERLSGLVSSLPNEAETDYSNAFESLGSQLEQIGARLDGHQGPAVDHSSHFAALNARFDDMSSQINASAGHVVDPSAAQNLEMRLTEIADRLQGKNLDLPPAPDTELLRNLEAQMSALSSQIPAAGASDLTPRLDQIEHRLAEQQDAIVTVAKTAVDEAITRLRPNELSHNPELVSQLSSDLKTLEDLSRQAEERNSRTFGAIHDTLLKIVDRLGDIDISGPVSPVEAVATMQARTNTQAPPFDAAMDEPHEQVRPAMQQTAQQAAMAAASAAQSDDVVYETAHVDHGGHEEPVRVQAGIHNDIQPDVEPAEANRPLEPGSGVPDVASILRRVREQKGSMPDGSGQAQSANNEFIIASRRSAAQKAASAAAAEAQIGVVGEPKGGLASSGGIGGILSDNKNALMAGAAAILIMIAGYQLFGFLTKDSRAPQVDVVATQELAAPQNAPAPTSSNEQVVAEASQNTTPADTVATSAPPEPENTLAPAPAPQVTEVTETAAKNNSPQVEAPASTETGTPVETVVAATDAPSIPEGIGTQALREAAKSGNPKALFEVARHYSQGVGVGRDQAKAAKYYEQAAEGGLAPAQYRVGNMYEKGIGVSRDIEAARTWYQMAAQKGNASAMHNLGVLFASGADGTPDNESAVRWFQKAAGLGVKDSQFNLGILSAKGFGVDQDLTEAYKWFALAAKAGDKDAGSKRDEVANAMRPDQLKIARGKVELWKPKPIDYQANRVSVPADWQKTPTTTASVDVNRAIKNIQLILNKNGYNAGPADGVMGLKTKEAIKRFQAENGMQVTGEVSEDLIQALLSRNQSE